MVRKTVEGAVLLGSVLIARVRHSSFEVKLLTVD
jgi:hypothetical protein